MKLFDFFESRDMCNVCGQTPCNCTHLTESVANPGRRLIGLFNLIYRNGGDDAVDYLLYNSPIFADYYDQYEGDLESIAAEVGPKELAVMVGELEEVAENEGLAENVDIGREWMSDTELDQYVPDALEQEWRELVGYNEDGNAHPLWINMTGDYEPRSSDPQHRAWMVKVANKWFAKKKIPNVTFFDVRDHDTEDELEWLVQIGQQGVAEGGDAPHWRVEQSKATGRYYVVTGYTSKSRRVWKSKQGAGDFNKKENAEAKAQELNQGVSEGVNDYLWHGSKSEHKILYPQQANDTGGKEESNKNAVYATPSAKTAIAMGLTTPGSDTGMFPNDPQMVLFNGNIRKGQMVYLHKVPKDLFIKHNSREWYSKPGVQAVKPIEVVKVPVDQWLHLIRQATPQDWELRKKYMKQGVAEGSLNELSPGLLQRAAQGAKVKRDQAMDPEVHSALGGGYMNPLAKHYDTVAKKFGDKAVKAGQRDAVKKIASPAVMRKIGLQGVAEGLNDTIYPNAEVIKSKNGKPVGEIYQDGNEWGCFHYKADRGYDMIDSREDAIQALKDLHSETARHRPDYTIKGVAENSNDTTEIAQELDDVLSQGVDYVKAVKLIAKKYDTHPEYVVRAYEEWGNFEHDDTFDLREQGVTEMDKSQPSHGRDGKISHSTYGSRDKQSTVGGKEHTARATTADKMMRDAHDAMMKSMSAADKVKKGWRNPSIKEQDLDEAANPAQQAAIAIAMKKAGKKPKTEQRVTPVIPVTGAQPVKTYPPQQIYTPPSGQSRTPPKPPSSGGGRSPAAVIDIQNIPVSEAISGLDLANALFKALDQTQSDIVRRFGHDVVGDAIMDVVDEYGEIASMSDLDIAVQDVLERLQSKTNVQESRHYFITAGTNAGELRNKFGLRKDNKGWFLSESNNNFRKLYLEATRTFTEYDLSKHTVSAATIGDDNFVSPVGSVPRGQQKQKVKKNG